MARPKQIEDDVLVGLIKKFFTEECKGDPAMLKNPEIVRYINRNGYPKYTSATLRRTPSATECIEKLKEEGRSEDFNSSVSFQTLDAAAFVDRHHHSREAMITALTNRDSYYKDVADRAARTFFRHEQLQKEYDRSENTRMALEAQITELKGQITRLEEQLKTEKAEKKDMEFQRNGYKNIVDTFVDSGIATELLIREGLLKDASSTGIIKEAIEEHVITSKTNIREITSPASTAGARRKKPASRSGSSVISLLKDFQ